jgi:non-heme chloroperoxidase
MKILKPLAVVIVLFVSIIGIAIILGGPQPPKPMLSVNQPFASVDFSDLPPIQHYTGKDGTPLGFRHYVAKATVAEGSIVLVHGSSASSNSMHVLAKSFAKAGYETYALDMRGHGSSGPKGQIEYIGQLEDDLEAFVNANHPLQPSTLAGFSSGGGFVLRFAGGPKQALFQNTLLLSPFLGPDAPTFRPGAGGWVTVGIPRIVALRLLNQFGITAFNHLAVTSFALDEKAKSFLTPEYSYALADNFQPHRDYQSDIHAMKNPCAILAGNADELFFTDNLDEVFNANGKTCTVKLLPDVGHITLTLAPSAVDAAVDLVISFKRQQGNMSSSP